MGTAADAAKVLKLSINGRPQTGRASSDTTGKAAKRCQWRIQQAAFKAAPRLAAYSLLSRETDYPLHLGVTEAGTPEMGVLKSAIGIGGLLCQGVGDTIRVSLTADPVEEVIAAKKILQAAGIRKSGPDLISCPTCGRTKYDMIPIAREVERRLQSCTKPITVAVMGCAVNGPGEARSADVGIAGGDGEGLLFRKGEILYKVPQDKLVDALMAEIERL